MRPLLLSLMMWPALLSAQYPLTPQTIHTVRFDDSDGTGFPTHVSGSGSGVPASFGGLFVPGTTSLATNAVYAFTDPSDPDVRAFGLKRASNANNSHMELLLENTTGRALKRLRVRARVWQVTEQGRASEVYLRYHRYPVTGTNTNAPGPVFHATTGPTNTVLNPVRKAWIDHTLLFATPIPDGEAFVIGFQFGNGDGSGSNAHMAIEEIRLYPDFVPATITATPGWRMLAPPVEGVKARDLGHPFTVQGVQGMDHPTDEPNLFMAYDGSGWTPVPDADAALLPGTGLLYYRYEGPSFEAGVFGHEPAQSVPIPLHSNGNGWNLVGNPFASAIRVSDLTSDGTISDVVAVWDPGNEDSPGTWILSSDPILDGRIAPWQGFMVWNDVSSPATTLTIPTTAKTTGGTFLKSEAEASVAVIPIELWRLEGVKPTRHDRGTQLWIGRRPNVDLPRLPPLGTGLGYLSFDGRSIASLANDSATVIRVPLTLELPAPGLWALSWPDHVSDTGIWHLRLHDKRSGVETAWMEEPRYAFESEAGLVSDRFDIVAVPTSTSLDLPLRGTESAKAPVLSAHPNPFNPTTSIRWSMPEPGHVRLAVFDLLGREVALLADGIHPAGSNLVRFDAAGLSSGLYLVRITTSRHTVTTPITLVK